MQKLYLLLLLATTTLFATAQADTLRKTRFVIGLAAPELLHLGINTALTPVNQIGFSAGVGPSWGTIWPTLNVEHRLYFGKKSEVTNRKSWFFKQGGTYFTASEKQSAVSFTVGADLKSKGRDRGWTIDVGGFFLFKNATDRKNQLFPAVRFQHYNYFKKPK